MIILIATVGVLVSFFVARAILGDASSEPQKVKKIEKITSEITPPDTRIFNSTAINPSVEVEIDAGASNTGTDTNTQTKE